MALDIRDKGFFFGKITEAANMTASVIRFQQAADSILWFFTNSIFKKFISSAGMG